jgi:TonB family protein
MALAAPRVPATDDPIEVTVGTTTVAQVPGMHARGFAAAGRYPGSIRFRPDQDLPRALRSDVAADKSTRLNVQFARRYAVQLDLGSMKAPLAALDGCMDDLIKGWGLDPVQQRQRKRAPEPTESPAKWFRTDDYPTGLNHFGVGGIVVLRLVVDADGTVTGCGVSKAGGDKAFEDLTCQLAKTRARFQPAIGAEGEPIPSVWIQSITWRPAPAFTELKG